MFNLLSGCLLMLGLMGGALAVGLACFVPFARPRAQLVLLVVSALLVGIGLNLKGALLSANGEEAPAIVQKFECDSSIKVKNRRVSVYYMYAVDGRLFEGSNSVHGSISGLHYCDSLKPGDRISVTYLPQEPSMSTFGSPAQHFGPSVFMIFIVLMLFYVAFKYQLKR